MGLLRLLCRIFFKLFVRTTVINSERVPTQGAVVLVANHETMLDMFMIGYRIPRYLKWMAKEELFKNKLAARILTYWGAYPLKRGKGDVTSYRATEEFLRSGEMVGMFPQGTRSKGRGRTLPVKPGFVRFALETGAVIQPVAIWGKIRLFGKAYVRFGEPIDVASLITADDADKAAQRTEVQELARNIMDDIYNMMEVPSEDNKG